MAPDSRHIPRRRRFRQENLILRQLFMAQLNPLPRDLEMIEVASHDNLRENRAHLVENLPDPIPLRKMAEDQQAHVRFARQPRGLGRQQMPKTLGHLDVLLQIGRLADQHIHAAHGIHEIIYPRGIPGHRHGDARPEVPRDKLEAFSSTDP